MRIIAIDPGTTNTGLVYMDGSGEVLAAKTITHRDSLFRDGLTKAGKPSREVDQTKLMLRSRSIYMAIRDFLIANPHDAVVIEGFQTFSHGGRANANTFQTPYLCGYMAKALEDEDVTVQTSTEVFKAFDKDSVTAILPGGGWLTNDHTRSAACHGIYYLRRNGWTRD